MFLTTRYFYISEKFKLISLCLLKKMRLNEVKKEEQEVLETRSIPLRNYLMKHVMPTLSQGLVECTKIRPEDPVDFLVRNVQYQRRITLPPPPSLQSPLLVRREFFFSFYVSIAFLFYRLNICSKIIH